MAQRRGCPWWEEKQGEGLERYPNSLRSLRTPQPPTCAGDGLISDPHPSQHPNWPSRAVVCRLTWSIMVPTLQMRKLRLRGESIPPLPWAESWSVRFQVEKVKEPLRPPH